MHVEHHQPPDETYLFGITMAGFYTLGPLLFGLVVVRSTSDDWNRTVAFSDLLNLLTRLVGCWLVLRTMVHPFVEAFGP